MGRLTAARRTPLVFLLAFGVALGGASSASAITSIKLSQVGHSDLAVQGLDGQTKPRGQNGDVATLGNAAFVAGGSVFHGAQSTPGRICTDYGGVKVVDLSNPAAPVVKSKIDIADTTGVISPSIKGNPRRNQTLPNVAASVSSVDALQFPDGKKVLAIATQRCEPSFFGGANIQFWDVSDLTNPTQLGSYQTATTAGIIEDVNMFTRADKPGKVFAVATLPFTGAGSTANGEFRLLDVSNPAAPTQTGIFPNTQAGGTSGTNNGCRIFAAGRSAKPTPDGKRAIASFYDGFLPPGAPKPNTDPNAPNADFGITNTGSVFNLDLDNLPVFTGGTGTLASPKTFTPNPPVWGYAPGRDGGQLASDLSATAPPAPEGNAADVQPYTGPSNQLLSFVSEDDVDPANTQVSISSPAGLADTRRGCFSPTGKRPYELPGQQLTGNTVYVGRACPASNFNRTTLRAEDPLLADPAGKIAVVEGGGDQNNGCSLGQKVFRLQAAGATGVMVSTGENNLNEALRGPAGGIPSIPSLALQLPSFNLVAGYVPNRILSGVAFPASFSRSTTTNVTVKPFAIALACPSPTTVDACDAATNTSPITITATNATVGASVGHGLVTGDRVAISGVQGNTAANGAFTVTVLNSTQFTLNGSTGNGTWTGGGTVQACAPSPAPCSASPARTDFARFRSVADATDPVASGQVLPASRFPVMPGQTYRAGAFAEVRDYTAGAFRAEVEFFDAGGLSLSVSQLTPAAGLTAVTARTRYEQTLTAPVGAATAGVKFEWTGGGNGTGFVDTFSFSPDNAQATVKDNPGAGTAPEWGAQRIIDFSQSPPTQVGAYRSPTSQAYPPPDDGIYAPRQARMFGANIAFSSWLSDGVRALDVSDPATPKEVGSFVPPAVADPSPAAGAGTSNLDIGDPNNLRRGASWPTRPLATGVGVIPIDAKNAEVVVSDINGGLYVLLAQVDPPPPPPGGGGGGNTSTLPGGFTTLPDLLAPGVSGFGLTNNPFTVGGSTPTFGSAAAKTKKHKKGTTLRYTLSEAATVKLAIAQRLAGRRKGKRCVAPTRKLRKAKKCTRVLSRGTLTRTSHQGKNSVAFSGRIGSRKLIPGSYQATLTATDAAKNTSKAKTITFSIAKR